MDIEKVKKLLVRIEWKYDSDYDIERCPSCENVKSFGHKEDCELRQILNDFEKKG